MKFIYPIVFYFLAIETVATDENYPSLVLDTYYSLAYPSLEQFSHNKEDRAPCYGFATWPWNSYNPYYFFCPAQSAQEQALNEKSRSRRALFFRRGTIKNFFLDLPIPTCGWPILPVIWRETYRGDEDRYKLGFEIYPKTVLETDREEIDKMKEDSFELDSIFHFRFDKTKKAVKSVEYSIHGRKYIPASSNKKNTGEFEKNLDFLEIDVDDRYEHFSNHLLPRMTDEKSSHPTAHRLGVRKVSLIPSDDFLAGAWKTATYADVITAPIWTILLLKWNAVEIFVRKLIRKHDGVLIVNGVSGTLDLVEKHYHPDDVAEKKLHVPKYVWKVVSPALTSDKAILIVMHNDPFSNETTSPRLGCAEDCTKYGWLLRNDDYRTGLIYCCRVNAEIIRLFDISLYEKSSKILDIDGHRAWDLKLSDVVFNPTELTYDW